VAAADVVSGEAAVLATSADDDDDKAKRVAEVLLQSTGLLQHQHSTKIKTSSSGDLLAAAGTILAVAPETLG
jgi:hypothetical protein